MRPFEGSTYSTWHMAARPQQWLAQITGFIKAWSPMCPQTAADKLEKEDLLLSSMQFLKHIKHCCLRAFAHAVSSAWNPLLTDVCMTYSL